MKLVPPCFSTIRHSFLALGAGAVVALSTSQAAPIIEANFLSTGSNQTLPGTQIGLTTNLPGGNWVRGGGYDWSSVTLADTANWNFQNIANLQQEKTSFAVSIASVDAYVKPTQISISSDIYFGDINPANPTGGVGYWDVMAPTDNSGTSLTGFTGVTLSRQTATAQVWVNGVAGATYVIDDEPLLYTTNSGEPDYIKVYNAYNISFDVDLTTGSLNNVVVAGVATGLTGSGVTDAGTNFAGVMAGNASNGIHFDNFVVAAVPEPGTVALLACGLGLVGIRRRRSAVLS